ncbi:hypothetical protein [Gloeobacter morelensis]|uniref:Uncharacterized protein n=1 Tax=Gloeobacter morelensis MG652769 TaxID=2781736 RepID=A0ABY3PLX2_9CYAN|nr:hypothetical protein [Gloeobacter morelensis]UFP94599.1 hypothetical protein ISF26_23180 [Gloeobacter morelensis MG652769]
MDTIESDERKVVSKLIDFEAYLYKIEVEREVKKLTQEEIQKFVTFRLSVTNRVALLKNAVLRKIADEFRQIIPELKHGIANLQSQLDSVEEIVQTLKGVSQFLEILDKFVALVI